MPLPKNPGAYPARFVEYAQRVGRHGQTIRVPVAGPIPDSQDFKGRATTGIKKAVKVQVLFYNFIGTLRKARAAGDELWTAVADDADQTMCYVDKTECCLWFAPKSSSWQSKLLATGGVVAAPAPADAVMLDPERQAELSRIVTLVRSILIAPDLAGKEVRQAVREDAQKLLQRSEGNPIETKAITRAYQMAGLPAL